LVEIVRFSYKKSGYFTHLAWLGDTLLAADDWAGLRFGLHAAIFGSHLIKRCRIGKKT
jgi:hypothetical protein